MTDEEKAIVPEVTEKTVSEEKTEPTTPETTEKVA